MGSIEAAELWEYENGPRLKTDRFTGTIDSDSRGRDTLHCQCNFKVGPNRWQRQSVNSGPESCILLRGLRYLRFLLLEFCL